MKNENRPNYSDFEIYKLDPQFHEIFKHKKICLLFVAYIAP